VRDFLSHAGILDPPGVTCRAPGDQLAAVAIRLKLRVS
jgi:hypothetical protein